LPSGRSTMAGEPAPLPPGSTLGVLGGGQLGRMLALSAARLGLRCHVYCPDPSSPAFDVAAQRTTAAYEDGDALDRFAAAVDAVTYEFENVPLETAARLARAVPVRPPLRALEIAQDRLVEKTFLEANGVAVAPFRPVDDLVSLTAAVASLKTPTILKTRRFGYDGKGQVRLSVEADLGAAFAAIGRAAAVLEAVVPFTREVSVVCVRASDGSGAAYDVVENVHRDGILATSAVPAGIREATAREAQAIALRIADALDHVGVLAVEFFVVGETGSERLLVNEIAPRVHNSGHWTEDACACSQFENHVRAVAGWPLGPVERSFDAVMTNLIGEDVEAWAALAAEPAARLHLYGKREARAGRKMGHVNRLAPRT
jgi:5-(carboxyamino)imidazole ribonucleotide synthase